MGLATALSLTSSHPRLSVAVLEKGSAVAQHQSSHNSGVVHSGIYYRPGSFRAQLGVEGAALMAEFCAQYSVPLDRYGKVIVATHDAEVPRLEELFRRGSQNGVPGLELVDARRLKELEPNAHGVAAIWSPNTAMTDFGQVARTIAQLFQDRGGQLLLGHEVTVIDEGPRSLALRSAAGSVTTRFLVNCAGLYADHLARAAGERPEVRIVPFRGEYYRVVAARNDLVRGAIYPVPDPSFPFLGVHFTRTIHGELEVGPNAVFALAREGYSWTSVHLAELLDSLSFPGVWRMAGRHWQVALGETYRSLNKQAFVASARKLVPGVRPEYLKRHITGVRAQAMRPDGSLVDDFVFLNGRRALHVLNAPSPAATASLAIGRHIVAEVERRGFGDVG